MVEFQTRIFSEDDGKIIGAEVTVYSEEGDKLGVIDIADATTLEEMQEQLAVIDETYFTEERLITILANSSETININATTLSGFMSSDFAKVSQLSAYAPLSHSHSRSQITDLYDYSISANNYNANIGSSVTVSVKVTNRATGLPAVGHSVQILKNGTNWKSGTTGVNGTFSYNYTVETWGLVTFSCGTSNVQINGTGWKLVETDSSHTLYVNESIRMCRLRINMPMAPYNYAAGEVTIGGVAPSQYASDTNTRLPFRKDVELWINSNGDLVKYSDNVINFDVYGWWTFSY